MATKLMFARLLKVDEAKREVSGIMVAEVPDKEGEIFDYESSKPYFKAWNRQFSKATAFLPEDERSLGNVREMHQAKAVGKLTACSYDDIAKSIEVTAKIVDDVAWKKCASGIYTGFSIGGEYVDTWEDGELTRYTARPAEASIVDNPCVPTAEFSLVRADGAIELRKFVQKEAKGMRIKEAEAGAVKKGMYDVSVLARLLQEAGFLQSGAKYERDMEQDDSTMPEDLKAWLASGVKILQQMVSEEGAELTGEAGKENQMSEKATTTGALGKASHSKETMGHLQAMKAHHDTLETVHKGMKDCLGKLLGEHTEMQGGTETKEKAGMKEVEPSAGSPKDGDNEKADNGELVKVLGQLVEMMKKQQDEPVHKLAARVVTKADDQGGGEGDEETKAAKKPTLVKNAQGDLDLDEDTKKKIAKSIYANPQVMAPLAK